MKDQKQINEAFLECLMKIGSYMVLPDTSLVEKFDELAKLIGCEDYKTL